jgi:hypothetical protein
MDQAFWNTVGQGSFKLCPDELIGVKLRGIVWKRMGMDPAMLAQESLNGSCPVNRTTVLQYHQRTTKVAQQMPKVLYNLIGSHVFMGIEAN